MSYQERALAIIDRLTDSKAINIRERGTLRRAILLPERPQGEWKKHGLCFECPECHCGCMFTIVDKIVYGELNFCPNCGAKMKGGADND